MQGLFGEYIYIILDPTRTGAPSCRIIGNHLFATRPHVAWRKITTTLAIVLCNICYAIFATHSLLAQVTDPIRNMCPFWGAPVTVSCFSAAAAVAVAITANAGAAAAAAAAVVAAAHLPHTPSVAVLLPVAAAAAATVAAAAAPGGGGGGGGVAAAAAANLLYKAIYSYR